MMISSIVLALLTAYMIYFDQLNCRQLQELATLIHEQLASPEL